MLAHPWLIASPKHRRAFAPTGRAVAIRSRPSGSALQRSARRSTLLVCRRPTCARRLRRRGCPAADATLQMRAPACRDLYIVFALKVLESYNYFRCGVDRCSCRLPGPLLYAACANTAPGPIPAPPPRRPRPCCIPPRHHPPCVPPPYRSLSRLFTLYLTEEFGVSDYRAGFYYGLWGTLLTAYGFLLGGLIDFLGEWVAGAVGGSVAGAEVGSRQCIWVWAGEEGGTRQILAGAA